ncbi:protein TolR [Rhodocyclaceae bacterium SMB388]
MRQRRLMNQINVVPYIDVMLVLLVIFMVTAPMIQTGSVDLPTVDGVPQPPSEAMFVVIRSDGSFALRQTMSAPARDLPELEVMRELKQAIEANPDQAIVIEADKEVKYQIVMDTLNEMRKAGFNKVGLQTQTGS